MYHVYTTPAFVIHSAPYGESGKFLLLFTKDFGMIGATAQGIRLSQSKLRYHIQDFNLSNISIVRGKEVWRIMGAHEIDHKGVSKIRLKILKLLKRLLHGEEKNEKLFEIIENLYSVDIKEEDHDAIECASVLRILYNLGYIREESRFGNILSSSLLDQSILDSVKANKVFIVKEINEALKQSHL